MANHRTGLSRARGSGRAINSSIVTRLPFPSAWIRNSIRAVPRGRPRASSTSSRGIDGENLAVVLEIKGTDTDTVVQTGAWLRPRGIGTANLACSDDPPVIGQWVGQNSEDLFRCRVNLAGNGSHGVYTKPGWLTDLTPGARSRGCLRLDLRRSDGRSWHRELDRWRRRHHLLPFSAQGCHSWRELLSAGRRWLSPPMAYGLGAGGDVVTHWSRFSTGWRQCSCQLERGCLDPARGRGCR